MHSAWWPRASLRPFVRQSDLGRVETNRAHASRIVVRSRGRTRGLHVRRWSVPCGRRTSGAPDASEGTTASPHESTGPSDESSAGPATTGDATGIDDSGGAESSDGGRLEPDCDAGAPVDAPDETWTWIEIEGTSCAFSGTAGFAINPTARSTKLLVALEGGGACFSEGDCDASRLEGIDAFDLTSNLPELRLFDRDAASNPFADYSFVFVPYCTGDFHSGDHVTEWGASHVGFANMRAFLDRIVPTFCDAEHVVLTGFSAGGFGATFNYPQVHEAFGSTAVDLVDDSGPYMQPPWMSSAMQAMFDAGWGFRANMPADCTDCSVGWHALYPYIAGRWPMTACRSSAPATTIDPRALRPVHAALSLGFRGRDRCTGRRSIGAAAQRARLLHRGQRPRVPADDAPGRARRRRHEPRAVPARPNRRRPALDRRSPLTRRIGVVAS